MKEIKERARDGTAYAIQFDIQSSKLLPRIQTSKSYYKTKITMHNMTFYDLSTKEAWNYWFSEADSSLEASTFASIIINHLEKNTPKRKSIYLVSDGCAAQNRNAVLSSALLRFAIKKKVSMHSISKTLI